MSVVCTSQVEAVTGLLNKTQQGIPDTSETKEREECFVPGLALSQGLPSSPSTKIHCTTKDDSLSPSPTIYCNNPSPSPINLTECCSDGIEKENSNHKKQEVDGVDKKLHTKDTNVADVSICNERAEDSKCLNLLNPLGEDLQVDVTSLVKASQCSQSAVTTQLTPTPESHRNDTVMTWPQSDVKDAMLPNSSPDQPAPEPIEEAFYSSPSQEYKGKQEKRGPTSQSCFEETCLGRVEPAPPTSCDELEALKELNELRAVDLEESQAFAVTVDGHITPAPSPAAKTK